MMTPQEVANCTFAKSMVGGYNMASVDDFLDKLTEDYSTLYKENAALKTKLKMTVDKMSEYRESEDAIRSTLLAAQKMSTAMITEAEQKRDEIVSNATTTARARVAELQQQIADAETRLEAIRFQVDKELETEEKRLKAGQQQLRAFIRDVQKVCNQELANLELLPELPVEEEPPQPTAPTVSAGPAIQVLPPVQQEEPQKSPQQEAAAPMTEKEDVAQNLAQLMSAFAAADLEEEDDDVPPPPKDGDPFGDEDLDDTGDTRILNLDDLQFGSNYTRD